MTKPFVAQRKWVSEHPEPYQIAPALLTVLMVLGSWVYYPWRHYDSWPVYLIVVGFLVLIVWHGALVATSPSWSQVLYAIANIGAYSVLAFYGLMLVTGDVL